MEFNAVPKIYWCSTLHIIEDEKRDFETETIVDWEPV